MSKYISKGSILHFDECEEVVGACGTPPNCRQGVPVLPTRLSLSKHRAVSGDIISPYKISLPNYKIGQRLLRSGHIYVYDDTQKVFHHYDVSDTGLLVYSPWTRETDDGLIPIGTPKGNYLPYMTLPEKSVCYIAYSPGVWNWEMLKRFQEDFETLREKIGIRVDVKSWVGSLKGTMTFPIDRNYKEFIDDLNGADLSFSEWTKEVNDQCGTGIPFPVADVHKQMTNQAMKLAKPTPKCCMGIALYDPAGLMNDLAHLSAIMSIELSQRTKQQKNDVWAIWSAYTLEAEYKKNLTPVELSKVQQVEKNGNLDILTEQPQWTKISHEEKRFTTLRQYIAEKGGGNIKDNVYEKERQAYLDIVDTYLLNFKKQVEKILIVRAELLKSYTVGSMHPLSDFYEVGSWEIRDDLCAIWARAIVGVSASKQGALILDELNELPINTKQEKDNPFAKALAGPTLSLIWGLAAKFSDYEVDVKDYAAANNASASLWSEIQAAYQRAKPPYENHENKLWSDFRIKTTEVSFGIKLNKIEVSPEEVLASRQYKLSNDIQRTGLRLYKVKDEFFPDKLGGTLKDAGVHWIGSKGAFVGLTLFVNLYNLNQTLQVLDDNDKQGFLIHFQLGTKLVADTSFTAGAVAAGGDLAFSLMKGELTQKIRVGLAIYTNRFNALGAVLYAAIEFINVAQAKTKTARNYKMGAGMAYLLAAYAMYSLIALVTVSGVALPFFLITSASVALMALGSTLASIADKYDPTTLLGWTHVSYWGRASVERFKSFEQERQGYYEVVYTPKIMLRHRKMGGYYIKIIVPFVGKHTLLTLDGLEISLPATGKWVSQAMPSPYSSLVYAPLGTKNQELVFSKIINYRSSIMGKTVYISNFNVTDKK